MILLSAFISIIYILIGLFLYAEIEIDFRNMDSIVPKFHLRTLLTYLFIWPDIFLKPGVDRKRRFKKFKEFIKYHISKREDDWEL